jgi:low affinity Fe/Cu permease
VAQGSAAASDKGTSSSSPGIGNLFAARPKGWAIGRRMEQFAVWTSNWTGSSWAFIIAAALVALWLVSGTFFHYSDTWQLVMNTISSIVTFLMVFLIQRSQNKDTLAMHVKLNEIVAALKGASNRMIDVENLSEDEVRKLQRRYQALARDARQGEHPGASCSIEQELANPKEPGALAPQDP